MISNTQEANNPDNNPDIDPVNDQNPVGIEGEKASVRAHAVCEGTEQQPEACQHPGPETCLADPPELPGAVVYVRHEGAQALDPDLRFAAEGERHKKMAALIGDRIEKNCQTINQYTAPSLRSYVHGRGRRDICRLDIDAAPLPLAPVANAVALIFAALTPPVISEAVPKFVVNWASPVLCVIGDTVPDTVCAPFDAALPHFPDAAAAFHLGFRPLLHHAEIALKNADYKFRTWRQGEICAHDADAEPFS